MKQVCISIFLFTALCTSVSCVNASQVNQRYPLVSLDELNRDPKAYFGKIRVRGYATFEFENLNLWDSLESENGFVCAKAIGIYEDSYRFDRYNRKFVEITGTFEPLCEGDFDASVQGPDDMCLSIGNCGNTGIRPWEIQIVE